MAHTNGAALRIDPDAGSSPVCPSQTPADDVLALEGLESESEEGIRFEITRKDWLVVARIVAAGDRVDARVLSRMFDPQLSDEFESEVTEDLDVALLVVLEWLDRTRADRIGVGTCGRRYEAGDGRDRNRSRH